MKSFVGLVLAVAFVEIASAMTPEYLAQAVAAKDKCAKEHNIDESVVQEFIKKKKLPETEPGKCMLACYMEEMKIMVDGKLNADNVKAGNKEKWSDASMVEKANEVAMACGGKVSPDGKNKCDYAHQIMACVLEEGIKAKIPDPFEDTKRR